MDVDRIPRTTVARVKGLILREGGPSVVPLLGAGASVRSGIPSSDQLAAMGAKWGYCRECGLGGDDPTVTRSDWLAWLSRQPWFSTDRFLEDQYPIIIERVLQPRDERRRFFLDLLKVDVDRSPGYEALAKLVAKGWIRTVLTPNFDGLIPDACRAEPGARHVDVVRSPSEAHLISTAPAFPQVICVHGSVEHYSDQNLEHETEKLDVELRHRLVPIVRDHPLLVLGYRGAEPSIMRDLLIDGTDAANGYRHGVFWCVLERDALQLHPLVRELAERLGENFQLVPIQGFDECMTLWGEGAPSAAKSVRRPVDAGGVWDLEAASNVALGDLDLSAIEARLADYCTRSAIPVPATVSRSWLIGRMREADLLVEGSGGPVPTRAAALLFGNGQGAGVVVTTGDAAIHVTGNLFDVAARTLEILNDANRPFRVKGPTSTVVRPYPPLAIKELVVNALVHRDHADERSVDILVDDGELRVISPGGVVPGLDPGRLGTPGAKAYRNPVIADVFFGTGMMDKAGSGLADALKLSKENGGNATFGPTKDNTCFAASLLSRPERPDPVTLTAPPANNIETFTTNVLVVEFTSDNLYVASTPCIYASEIYDAHPSESLPRFAIHGGRLFTFSDLGDPANRLGPHVEGDIEQIALDEMAGDDLERLVVQLMNKSLKAHARKLGLLSVPKDDRLYFPKADNGSRQITYQGRLRRATRTVTRPLINKVTEEVRFWEHEALAFRFRRFGPEWGLMLIPGWVFSRDGERDLLTGPRVSRLSTRRSASNYNPQVSADLFFWSWVLTEGNSRAPLVDESHGIAITARLLEVEAVSPPALGPEDETSSAEEDALIEELASIAGDQGDS